MKSLERYWFGDVALARPYLLTRILLGVLTVDVWLNLMPYGARYGVAAFNVAHFAWLDAFVPKAGFYMGLLAFTSVLALSQALYRPHRIAIALVAVTYSLAWACSLLDSAPFHYLLSLYLICLVFFPLEPAESVFEEGDRPSHGSSWGYVLLCVTTAIMYFYVAAWTAAEDSSYVLPMLSCAGYLIASAQDRAQVGSLRRVVPVFGVPPILFALIGPQGYMDGPWFRYTMIAVSLIVFTPAEVLDLFGRLLTKPGRVWAHDRSPDGLDETASRVFYASLAGLCVAPMVSSFIDLPGVKTGCALTAIAMLFVMGHGLYRTPRLRPVWRVISLFVACFAFFVTVTLTSVRAEYYRLAASDAEVRGESALAEELRSKAAHYGR